VLELEKGRFTECSAPIMARCSSAGCTPEANELADRGWLRRQFEPNGDVSWWLTPQGDVALILNALTESVRGREN
jgi:hypothetical protein